MRDIAENRNGCPGSRGSPGWPNRNFLRTKLKYAISDYNEKRRGGRVIFFYFKLGNDKKVRCLNVIMRGLAAKKEGM